MKKTTVERSKEVFKKAFRNQPKVDFEDEHVKSLILSYAALLEMGVDYIELLAFKDVQEHIIENTGGFITAFEI